MNGYATHELAKMRQQEFMAEAANFRLAKEARAAARGTARPRRRPIIWLREAAHAFAARLVTLGGAQAASH